MKNALFFMVCAAAAFSAINVPLEVYNWADIARTGEPVTAGIPLPAGAIYDLSVLRMTDGSGNTIPAQFRPLTKWWYERHTMGITNPSAKWVLCDFQANVSAKDKASFSLRDDNGNTAPTDAVTLTQDAGSITIVTGPLKFILSKTRFNLFDEAWIDANDNNTFETGEKIFAAGNNSGGFVTAGDWAAGECVPGTVHRSTKNAPDRIVIEEQGAMKVIIRVEGRHFADANGVSLGLYGYQCFITAYAGKPYVDVQWALSNIFMTGTTSPEYNNAEGYTVYSWPFKGYTLDLDLGLGAGSESYALLGESEATGTASGTAARLFQRPGSYTLTNAAAGTAAKGGVSLSNGTLGLRVAIRDFSPNAPKAVSVLQNKISLEMFPDTGTFYWLEAKTRKNQRMRFEFFSSAPVSGDLTGLWQKTDAPMRMLAADRAWYRNTDAWERVFGLPADAQYNRKAPTAWTRMNKNTATKWQTYAEIGEFNGGGDHWNLTSCFWNWAMTANPAEFEGPEACVFFFNDRVEVQNVHDVWTRMDFCLNPVAHLSQYNTSIHGTGAGFKYTTFPGYATQTSCHVPDGGHMTQLQEIEYYQFTGDLATLDAIKSHGAEAAWAVFGMYNPYARGPLSDSIQMDSIPLTSQARYISRPSMVCGHAYEVTGDENYFYPAKLAAYSVRNTVRFHPVGYMAVAGDQVYSGPGPWEQDHPGIPVPAYYSGSDFQIGIGMEGLYSFWKKSGDEEIRDALTFAGIAMTWRSPLSVDGHYGGFVYGGWCDYGYSGKRYDSGSWWSSASEGFGGCIFSYLISGRPDLWNIVSDGYTAWSGQLADMKGLNLFTAKWKHDSLDAAPPAAVIDLAASSAGAGSIRLDWTAPTGNPAKYQVKVAHAPITEIPDRWDPATGKGWPDLNDPLPYTGATLYATAMKFIRTQAISFWAAVNVEGEPVPAGAGTPQTFTVSGLSPDSSYYFALVSWDSAGNGSYISNVVSVGPTLTSVTYRSGDTAMADLPMPILVTAVVLSVTDTTGAGFTFSSLDPTRALCTWDGKVTGLEAGIGQTARIQVKYGLAAVDTLDIAVAANTAPVDSIIIVPTAMRLCAGEWFGLNTVRTWFSAYGLKIMKRDLPKSYFTWTSSDSTVAIVQNGAVMGLTSGIADITAERMGTRTTVPFTIWPKPAFMRRFDFACDSVVRSYGWSPVWDGCSYNAARGFGLTSGSASCRSYNRGNILMQTFLGCANSGFRVDLPNGDYILRMVLGNNNYPNPNPLTEWINYGTDTLIKHPLAANDGNTFKDDTVTVTGDTGFVLNINAAVCYMVIISKEGIDIGQVAADTGDIPAPSISVEKKDKPVTTITRLELLGYPNPFNPSVNIRYALTPDITAAYRIFNMRGQLMYEKRLFSGPYGAMGEFSWQGTDRKGRPATSGFYVGRLETSTGRRLNQKLLLLK